MLLTYDLEVGVEDQRDLGRHPALVEALVLEAGVLDLQLPVVAGLVKDLVAGVAGVDEPAVGQQEGVVVLPSRPTHPRYLYK